MEKRDTILVTGAGGFVGQFLVRYLSDCHYRVRALTRNISCTSDPNVDWRPSPELSDPDADWTSLVRDVDCVIHLAARVHVMNETAKDPLSEFMTCNATATRLLFNAARSEGVKLFIFISTIKVNGEATHGTPFRALDNPHPMDAYARSKLEAEKILESLTDQTMAVSVIRPPLIYGPGVKGNMRSLVSAINRGIPLPLAGVQNRRHMLSIGNLLSLIHRILEVRPDGFSRFLAADQEAVSTSALIRSIGSWCGRPPRLFFLPPLLLRSLAWVMGRSPALQRLTGDLEIDIEATCTQLKWEPAITWEQGIAEMLAGEETKKA